MWVCVWVGRRATGVHAGQRAGKQLYNTAFTYTCNNMTAYTCLPRLMAWAIYISVCCNVVFKLRTSMVWSLFLSPPI